MDLALKFVGFLATAYLARVLGKSGFGAINVAQSILNYAIVLSTGGVAILGTRKIASNLKVGEITGQIFYGRFIFSTIVFLVTITITFLLSGLSESFYIIFTYMLFLFPTVFMLGWFFVGIQKMETVAYARIIGTIVYFIIVVLIVKERQDAVLTGIAWTTGGMATTLFFLYFYKRYGYSFHLSGSKRNFLEMLKESFPLGIASYISQFLVAFPVIYVAFIAGNSEAGIFSAALKMTSLFLIFDRVFATLFLPKITNVITTRESSLEELFNTILKIIVLSTLAASIFLFLFSELIIIKVFGSAYTEAIFIFKLLLVYFVFTIIDSVFANTLIGLMKEKVYTISLLIALIIFLTSTFILTPFLEEYGVIYSFIIINIISLSYMSINLRKEIKIKLYRLVILPLLCTLIILLFFIFFPIPIYIELMIAFLIFIPLLIKVMGFGKDEINFIRRVFI
jgi:O-antigen/teichoic acid export membrane protein